MLSPRQIFEDNIRPATLLLKVYRLLEHDKPVTEGEIVQSLRDLVQAGSDEELMVIYNEIFLGLIRERAEVSKATIRRSASCNLLRQAVVTASTAMETYLPILLQANLDLVITAKGREFVPKDEDIEQQFEPLAFTLKDALRLLNDSDPFFIANKMISSLKFAYLSGKREIHVTGTLLAIDSPWKQVAERLKRDSGELQKIVNDTVNRRNDVVHRADRDRKKRDGPAQEIAFAWAPQAVDTIRHVCLCLDELVATRMNEWSFSASCGSLSGGSEEPRRRENPETLRVRPLGGLRPRSGGPAPAPPPQAPPNPLLGAPHNCQGALRAVLEGACRRSGPLGALIPPTRDIEERNELREQATPTPGSGAK